LELLDSDSLSLCLYPKALLHIFGYTKGPV